MNTSDTAKNSIASALAEQIHKNFNYVIKSSSENGYNATVTTEITTFDSDSILADYQEKLDKYLASADAVIDGSQKRYEKSFEILLNSINDNTVTTVNDVDFVLLNDGVSWKLQEDVYKRQVTSRFIRNWMQILFRLQEVAQRTIHMYICVAVQKKK